MRLLSAGHGRKSDAHDLRDAVTQTATTLIELFGVGPILAAKLLGEVGDVRRFATKHRFAAHNGTAPIEASSGEVVCHPLSRAGNRKLTTPCP